jgi:hypothetical protein
VWKFASVNGGASVLVQQPDTGGGHVTLSVPVKLNLKSGANSITFSSGQSSQLSSFCLHNTLLTERDTAQIMPLIWTRLSSILQHSKQARSCHSFDPLQVDEVGMEPMQGITCQPSSKKG